MKPLNRSKWLLKQVKLATDDTENNLMLEIFMEMTCCKHQFTSYHVLYATLWLQKLEHYDFAM